MCGNWKNRFNPQRDLKKISLRILSRIRAYPTITFGRWGKSCLSKGRLRGDCSVTGDENPASQGMPRKDPAMYDCTIAGGTALAVEVATAAAQLGLRTALIEPPSAWEISSESVGPQWSPTFLRTLVRENLLKGLGGQTLAHWLLPYGRKAKAGHQALLRESSVDRFAGSAKIVGIDGPAVVLMARNTSQQTGSHPVEDGPLLMTRTLIVATGSAPARVCHGGGWQDQVESKNRMGLMPVSLGELFLARSMPKSLVVLGSNSWAEAVAEIYSRLGIEVLLLGRRLPERLEQPLWRELRAGIRGLRQRGDCCEVELCHGERVLTQGVVSCQTEVGITAGLNLEKMGIETDECGRVWCDAVGRTWHPKIVAMGSVVGFPEELRQPRDIRQLLEELYLPRETPEEDSSSRREGRGRMKSPKWLSASKSSSQINLPAHQR